MGVIIYRLSQYPIGSGFAEGYWSAATSGFGTVRALVERFNSNRRFLEPLQFEGDGLTPKGVYTDCFGNLSALRLEYVHLKEPDYGNVMKVIAENKWQPDPICPWSDVEAFGKPVPKYRFDTTLTLLRENLPDLDEVQLGYITSVIRRSVAKNSLSRNKASLLRFMDETMINRLIQTMTTG